MDKKAVRWLYEELPEWVNNGMITPDAAERIRAHYGEPEAAGSTAKRWAIVLFSILGAALIGGGIILLLAHNWEEISRPARAALAVMPLAIAAALGAWLLWKNRESTAWREGTGTFQTLSVGVAIALVAQTYNLGGKFNEFMLTWSLLSLPIAYLLGATLPILLYLTGITVWTGSVMEHGGQALWFFPLAFLAVPYLWMTARENSCHPRPVLVAWALAIVMCVGSGMALGRVCGKLAAWPILYGGLFGLLFLSGAHWWSEATKTWQRPLQNIGALGALGLSLALSFGDTWSKAHWYAYWDNSEASLAVLKLAVAAVFPVAAILLWVRSWSRSAWLEVIVGAVPVMAIIGWTAALRDAEAIGAILFNLYLFALGIGTLTIGLRDRRLGVVNAGMFVLAAVILCRFFDADLGFVLRGIVFILIGLGFLTTNLVLLRWRGGVKR